MALFLLSLPSVREQKGQGPPFVDFMSASDRFEAQCADPTAPETCPHCGCGYAPVGTHTCFLRTQTSVVHGVWAEIVRSLSCSDSAAGKIQEAHRKQRSIPMAVQEPLRSRLRAHDPLHDHRNHRPPQGRHPALSMPDCTEESNSKKQRSPQPPRIDCQHGRWTTTSLESHKKIDNSSTQEALAAQLNL